ncbi:MAG: hypothetical protein L7V86_28135 [Verrucomicrobiales bacterium]|jgi:hypothetical protein|nr:hypothetical protein [Verrucomicrobiales bacterium]
MHPGGGWKDTAMLRTRSDDGKEVIEQPVDYGNDERGFWIVAEEPTAELELP